VAFQPGPGGWAARGEADQTIAVWSWPGKDMAFGGPGQRLAGHTGLITRLRRLADGRLLSEGRDGLVLVWDPLTGRRLASYAGVGQALASADGRRVWMQDADGSVGVIDLPPAGQALLDQARARGGALTAADRARYFLAPAPAK
jgi:WD40 repeat protein